ncbi:MAG: hypothetical protein EOS65_19895 [Mesorhizobium sp.]|uniref:hypothetical protein n=1 Tax=Mesorhizobium sp. TaxID=1871066 RepID=UPI000FD1DCAF|nr:hypothetical protein [Mesorhizobium sp.]RVC58849.1 hypothetical protein EN779_17820 [Mesorhizobium sp. M4B.F.Ca.ET.088.02.2.1]RWF25577.1 MAG: hypothetical protein EOS45_30260 [Mesorhizobium sp.]RWF39306.1 MAG: hypothetical protein EOS65_19895 [Mesorhizobium sp.]TIX17317.1 MAG: hypothetical protein E5V41_11170 [Mesorhizobium sp.]TIX39118.1 MAG: hypothetical protein E5V40_17475 [Mesorhizobium sp.]
MRFGRADEWKFRSTFDPERHQELMGEAPDFNVLVDRICAEAINFNPQIEPPNRPELERCHRLQCWFEVERGTFDAFFNGPTGLRAQYLIHAEQGQAANGFSIAALRHRLLQLCDENELKFPGDKWPVANSIDAASARIWRYEPGRSSPTHDLDIDGWDRMGKVAPAGTFLVVNGGWIEDDTGHEVVIPDKIRRRFEIHDHGYS